jgi:hypothetical protein
MRLPRPRGPVSQLLIGVLRGEPVRAGSEAALTAAAAAVDPLCDADLHLALACAYHLHYAGFTDVDDDLEWDPQVLALRAALERPFRAALEGLRPEPADPLCALPIDAALRRLVAADDGPPLSAYLMRSATLDQFREFVRQRSVYHLREADPHLWQVPRLTGRPKAALVEILADEYGGGRPARMHSAMFATAMRALGLDDTYGAYWDTATGETLAANNLMSLFGLHRRHRGALLGQLAAFEMTSTAPNRRYANGLRRLGLGPAATAYYDEHVEADAVHEQLAAVDLCGSFVAAEADPGRAGRDVLWGAACGLLLDGLAAGRLLATWQDGTGRACA